MAPLPASTKTQRALLLLITAAVSFLVLDLTHVRTLTKSKTEREGATPTRRLMEQSNTDFDASDPHLALFQLSDYTVLGPTHFPEPHISLQRALQAPLLLENPKAPKVEVAPILKPRIGDHRPDQDAVFSFASEYSIHIYQMFILSLRKTGFQGDIVLAVSPNDLAKEGETPNVRQKKLEEFFSAAPNVIIYVVDFTCYNSEGGETSSAKGGIRTCHCHVLYGTRNVTIEGHPENDNIPWEPLNDMREQRPVATTRYELYWLWSIKYQPHTWQMLVDARDTFFQTDPFAAVPRETELDRPDGVLFFFGENAEATRIGKSEKNRKWITTAYGEEVIQALQDKPTICSGATLGEQIALETYLRAMVNEFDETGIKLMGMDQGFHNYVYYSGKLQNALKIRSISVFDQGRGIVSNMGAMRIKTLGEWGNGKLVVEEGNQRTVLNWDGSPSPVVHQFDRFKSEEEGKAGLGAYFYKQKTRELQEEWYQQQAKKSRI